MRKNKINKKILILLFFATIICTFSMYLLFAKPVYFVSDSSYLETTVSLQKNNLYWQAVKKFKKLKIIESEYLDTNFIQKINDKDALVIFSPLLSYFVEDRDIKIENPFVSINVYNSKGETALSDSSNEGWKQVAKIYEKNRIQTYLISDKDWPSSQVKAQVIKDNLDSSLYNEIELNGDELNQYAVSLINKLKKENIYNIICTGSNLIDELNSIDSGIYFSLPSDLYLSVDRERVDYLVSDNLLPLISAKGEVNTSITLKQKVYDLQGGLRNFFQLLWLNIRSKFL